MYSTHRSLTAVHTILLRNDDLCGVSQGQTLENHYEGGNVHDTESDITEQVDISI